MATIVEVRPASTDRPCPMIDDPVRIEEQFTAVRFDESRIDALVPKRIFLPENLDELSSAVAAAARFGGGMTLSGGRTGIVGGAAAYAENLVVTERLKEIGEIDDGTGVPTLQCGAGVTLDEIREHLSSTPYRYPVDPTETTATIGGTVATNASGARTLKHGPTRNWIAGATVVLVDGSVLDLARGDAVSADGRFEIRNSRVISIDVDPVRQPGTKHNAGYFLSRPADLLDLFIGSEGTLGVVAGVRIRLDPRPDTTLGITLFPEDDSPVGIVRDLKNLDPAAIEYMDGRSLDLLRAARAEKLDGGAVPEIAEGVRSAIYLELELASEDELDEAYERLEPLLEFYGIDLDATWAAFDEAGILEMKHFRHALPERVNAVIGTRKQRVPEIRKVGTDMAVPLESLEEMLSFYRETLNAIGVEYVIFGHIGDGHLHVNIIPRTVDELHAGHEAYFGLAERAVALGGSVAAEHGIGRIKREFMRIQYDSSEIDSMATVKRALDPRGHLNPGVLFPDGIE